MRKTPLIKLVLALIMVISPLLMSARGQIFYTVIYDNDLSLGNKTIGGVTYSTVSYDGLRNVGDPGKPSLPVNLIKFSVPYNAKNFGITAIPVVDETIELDYPVFPIQAYWTGEVTQPISSIYQSTAYPSQIATIVDEGMLAGENHVVTVAVFPMVYNPSQDNTLNVMSSVSLTLEYDLSDTLNVIPVIRKGRDLRNEGYELVRNEVVNPNDVVSNAASSANHHIIAFNPFNPEVNDTLMNPETYLVITTPELRHSMRRLVALNKQRGMNVKVVTVNEALNDSVTGDGDYYPWGGVLQPVFTDDAGKLRNYLRACYYDRGTEYVLLAGTDVPYRAAHGGQADMYFSELNANWYYSFYEDEEKYGELYVGRLLGTESQEFDNYTDKLLKYELNPGNGDPSYLTKALFTEGIEFPGDMDDFVIITSELWQNVTTVSEIEYGNYPTGCDVLDSISTNHYGFICTFNQGFPSNMRMYGPYHGEDSKYIWALSDVKDDPYILDDETDNGLDKMDNMNCPAVYFSPIGDTMSYDCLQNYGLDVNYGESFTMGKDYGGPAYLGMTMDSYYSNGILHNYYNYGDFTWNISNAMADGNCVLGQTILRAKSSFSGLEMGWREMVSCYNYLGDPALQMWTDLPQNYSNITITRTDNNVTVSGMPANNTTVAYCSNDGTTGKCKATSTSITLNNLSPNSSIMLYNRNYIPYIAPLILQNTDLDNSQYVIANEVIAGKSVDSSRTNGNVTVKAGADYEIEAKGKVTFAGGFKVERGASLAVRKSSF